MSTSPPERLSTFMQRALYDPRRGYYTARIRTVGARGDFSTTATLTPRLGTAIAAWLRQQSRDTGVRTVIEIGGGDGSLMHSVLRALGWWRRLHLRVYMVESSPVLTSQQRLKAGRGVSGWFATLPEALAACGGEALIYSNELLDAFPVDQVQWDGTQWQEVCLQHDGTAVREEMQPLALLPQETQAYSVLSWRPARAQRAELHTTLRAWLAQWLPGWRRGAMLAVDYGGELADVYHRRPRGTLRAYLMQQRIEGPDVYANPGHQDITCDVNFTDVRAWLREHGTTELSCEPQAAFLQRLAPLASRSPADAFAAAEEGAGGAFQCLAVRRG